jgi:hypothetical protein
MATKLDIIPRGVSTPSRRGFLGLFGAASVAAASGGISVASAIRPSDWRSKPVAEWTQADFIAEAEFELAAHTKKSAEVFKVGMSHHEEQLYQAHLQFKSWWRIELMERRGDFA